MKAWLLNEFGLDNLVLGDTPTPEAKAGELLVKVGAVSLNFRDKSSQGYGYAVFGKVTAGMDVVDKIVQVPSGNRGPHQNVPLQPVTIIKVTRTTPATP